MQLIKEFLRALILAIPFKLTYLCINHVVLHTQGDCLWCVVAAFALLPLSFVSLVAVEFIYKAHIKPFWIWVWSDED